MNVRFLTLAQQDIADTVLWFEETQPGTSVDFLAALDQSVRLIAAYPFVGEEIEPEIRRCLFNRFPYALIYGIEDQTIIVIAVAHTRRDPHYWMDRVF
ncbi:MAG TPA: type II toxin-antitoxin system RelE/ParE family toxin [Pyrinomonadaceae bacterium]|nr:type II toxin-antitoxin system RelE/ParE family toxin [Pyrinomonadaceae bacterium]